ncbi:hypothetical protein [Microbispora sp. H13382]|uniref:hypothetical protein n=1 Tax=Microbispora sp. H13382 TaxID=2729112 RepID=UPI001603C30D|nr:hypothetical protein [Microbispora sp. H13382]
MARDLNRLVGVLLGGAIISATSVACSGECNAAAQRYFSIVENATQKSFGGGVPHPADEVSGCDSGDDPSVLIWMEENGDSAVEIAGRMELDDWKMLSRQEARRYLGEIALEKRADGQTLIAVVRSEPGVPGKVVEVVPEG